MVVCLMTIWATLIRTACIGRPVAGLTACPPPCSLGSRQWQGLAEQVVSVSLNSCKYWQHGHVTSSKCWQHQHLSSCVGNMGT